MVTGVPLEGTASGWSPVRRPRGWGSGSLRLKRASVSAKGFACYPLGNGGFQAKSNLITLNKSVPGSALGPAGCREGGQGEG